MEFIYNIGYGFGMLMSWFTEHPIAIAIIVFGYFVWNFDDGEW